MSNESDLTTAVATEIAKQIPLKTCTRMWDRQLRRRRVALADMAKTLRLALAPLQYTAALQDRYVRFLRKSVRQVPEADRIAPPPQILGPVVQGIKYEPADTPISEMFSNLLSKAFDAKDVVLAHPSYPSLIRQLSSDEARLLMNLKAGSDAGQVFEIVDYSDLDQETRMFVGGLREVDQTPRKGIVSERMSASTWNICTISWANSSTAIKSRSTRVPSKSRSAGSPT